MQYECVMLKGPRSMLSSNTVHLVSQQQNTRDHCLAALWLSSDRRVGLHYTNNGVFAKCRLISEVLSVSGAPCRFRLLVLRCDSEKRQELTLFSAAARVMKVTVAETPYPTLSLLLFYPPPRSHFHYYFSLILWQIFPPPDHRASRPLQTTARLRWSIDPHPRVSVASPLSALVWNWIADPLALSGRDVI